MSNNRELLNKVFPVSENGDLYYIMTHSGKIWLDKERKDGFQMYQPTRTAGILYKKMAQRGMIRLKKCNLSVNGEICAILEKIIPNQEKEIVAAYAGENVDSGSNNKITIQLKTKSGKTFFVKITENPEIYKLFQKNVEAIDFLKQKSIDGLPSEYGCFDSKTFKCFWEDTLDKEKGVSLDLDISKLEYIRDIVEKTVVNCSYKESNFSIVFSSLREKIKKMNNNHEKVLLESMMWKVEGYLDDGNNHCFSFSHGDFSPWNIYCLYGQVHMYDLEYCYSRMPCYIDVFHYMCQAVLLGKKQNAHKLILYYEEKKKLLNQYIDNADLIFACYLLYIISFYYNHMNEENLKTLNHGQYKKWIHILEYLDTKI